MLSLARGLSVIRAFADGQPQLTVADAARLTGMSRAAARRCLYTLSALGYATSAGGAYTLTPAILALGYAGWAAGQVAFSAAVGVVTVATAFSACANTADGVNTRSAVISPPSASVVATSFFNMTIPLGTEG